MTPYVIYARKSTESDDRQVVSIESQVKELQLLAAQQNIHVAEVLTESRSAKNPGRPVFGEMMRRIHRGQIRGVLCWKMDRLARNHLDHGAILQVLADKLLERIVTTDRPYTSDGTDRFIGNFELGMATKYSDDLSQNVRRGIRACFERGRINHNPKLGYILDPITKETIADPDRFDKVQRMLTLIVSGSMSPRLVLKIATSQWHLTTRKGKPVSRATFYAMLADPVYAGINQLRDGRRYRGTHPAMISLAEFHAIQEILGRRGRPRPKVHAFAFTGIVKCGHCGGGVTAEEHTKKSGRRYVYYRCSRRRAGVTCREEPISETELIRQLSRRIRFLSMPERIHNYLCREALAERVQEQERQRQIKRTVEEALKGLDAEGDELLDLRTTKTISQERFSRKEKQLEDRRALLHEQHEKLKTDPATGQDLVQVFNFAARATEVLQTGTPVQQRMIAERIGLNYSLKGRKVAFSLDKPFDRMAEAGGLSNWSGLLDDVRTWLNETASAFRIPYFANP